MQYDDESCGLESTFGPCSPPPFTQVPNHEHAHAHAHTHRYSFENAPIQKELSAREVGNAAAFLLSPLASAITGQVCVCVCAYVYVWLALCSNLFK